MLAGEASPALRQMEHWSADWQEQDASAECGALEREGQAPMLGLQLESHSHTHHWSTSQVEEEPWLGSSAACFTSVLREHRGDPRAL